MTEAQSTLQMRSAPALLYTPGDPAGIGYDLAVAYAHKSHGAYRWMLVGDPHVLEMRSKQLDMPVSVEEQDIHAFLSAPQTPKPGGIICHPVRYQAAVRPGEGDQAHVPQQIQALNIACDACLNATQVGLVTGPVNKRMFHNAGVSYRGHTEFLAQRCGDATPVMLMVKGRLRIALASTHIALKQVSTFLTAERLEHCLRVLALGLQQDFGIRKPKIRVCALNPHAGDGGAFGSEDPQRLEPVIVRLHQEGMDVEGPFAADTLLQRESLLRCDAVLSLFHDQGLPVIKYEGLDQVVNMTLGLKIVRTSVSHGTAYDLAATGRARISSLVNAFEQAHEVLCRRAKYATASTF